MKKILCAVLALALVLCSATAAFAQESFEEKFYSVSESLSAAFAPQTGSIGGEWLALGLSRSGALSDAARSFYLDSVRELVLSKGGAQLHYAKSTENSRIVLALTALGEDPRGFCGFDLTYPLGDMDFLDYQGLNGVVWALIALDSLCYEIPSDSAFYEQATREGMVDYILSAQLSAGGWAIDGSHPDTDMTAMCVQALAPYYQSGRNVKSAVDRALVFLSDHQNADGCFVCSSAASPEGSAQVIVALTALGISPDTDSRFIKDNNSALDGLMFFSVDGGFEHYKGGGYNQMSTEQAYYAMTAYKRLLNGENSLYDMTDNLRQMDVNFDSEVNINDATDVQKFLADLQKFTLLQKKLSDSDKNGEVSVNDVTVIQKYIAGIK